MQNMSENEALQYQLCTTSCLRGNKCSLGTSTCGYHWSVEHQGQRTQEKKTSAIYCPDVYRPCSQSTRGWNSQGQDVQTSYKDIQRLWLSRYPRPRTCVHDCGPEFIAHEFQTMLEDTGIGSRPTSAQNPQSNGIIEQVHCTIAAVIRIVVDSLSPIDTVEKANDIVQDALHKAMHAVRCASHNLLDNISPGALTFQRDMYLDILLIVNVLTLADVTVRQKQIDKHLMRANVKCKTHDYQVGDQVLIKLVLDANSKLEPTYKGPYPTVQVHTWYSDRLATAQYHGTI
jgi:hypothetical protein